MTDLLATYRLQLSPEFGFSEVADLADYMTGLGISHVHLSPCLEARLGSPHGYDVIDPTRVRQELGGEAGMRSMAAALSERGIGIVLDFVPNHMAASDQNPWWRDVLARGRDSSYAHFFDIDWESPEPDLAGKVLLPVLSTEPQEAIEHGDITVVDSDTGPVIAYKDLRFPIAPGTLPENAGADTSLPADASQIAAILERQNYLLASWQRGATDLNYRRFTNVSGLAAVRVELDDVFDAVHGKVLELISDGVVQALRIDHVDGLRDPAAYLTRLHDRAPNCPVFVEKVLTRDERLRSSWPIKGTTGYDFLKEVGGLFVDERGEENLSATYADFTGSRVIYEALEAEKKRLVLEVLFPAEVNRLVSAAGSLDGAHGSPEEPASLAAAIRELAASFPVYRTYVTAGEQLLDPIDIFWVDRAICIARDHRPDISDQTWFFLRDLLLLRYGDQAESEFVSRFQQITAATMAKGVEDTAFYCYNRLTSLNEVGGDPLQFGITPDAFHAWCEDAARSWPERLSVVSTHDTKRSADARLRISALSEIPEAWSSAARRWSDLNKDQKTAGMPDADDEYLIYQTLVGTWPIELERAKRFAHKAVREAKRRTAWTTGNEAYDGAVDDFVEGILSNEDFTSDLGDFIAPLEVPWKVSSLAQTLLHMTAPGIPQIYRGDELWYLSLVDPDNRRPVDFGERREILGRLDGADTVAARDECGELKLRVIREALKLRRRLPDLFRAGASYEPLPVFGRRVRHVVAFTRHPAQHSSGDGARGPGDVGAGGPGQVVCVVPRLLVGLGGDWDDTALRLPDGTFTDVFTGAERRGTVSLTDMLSDFPVSLLVSEEASG